MLRIISLCLMILCTFRISMADFIESTDNNNNGVQKKLYLADFQNDRIWIMNLDNLEVTTSYPAPTRKFSDAFPIGLALLKGNLYVNNFNFTIDCTDDDMFVINPQTGKKFGWAKTPGCNPLDGMATIPEAGLIVGIEITTWLFGDTERLHFFKPAFMPTAEKNHLVLTEVGTIDVDVPGASVRGLAYLDGKLYISEEDTLSIYIYQLNLPEMTVRPDGTIYIGTAAPGLASYGSNLIAYDIWNHKLLIIEAQRDGQIVSEVDLSGTGIGQIGALETKLTP